MNGPDTDLDFASLQAALAGTWSIECEIGRGGMGVVFLARDVSLDRAVAIKVLHPHLATHAEARDRFLQEARTGARLSHPHIVPIYAVDTVCDFVFFVMGLVDGESLGARIRREGPLSPLDAMRVMREIGWALGYAHATGLLHRDVTLDNVLIERQTGRAVLADFGIAAPVDSVTNLSLVGTPAYIAPELVHGETPSVHSDLYALGVTSWAMLAGRLPLDGEDAAATLMMQVTTPTPSLASAAPATPSRVVRAIQACLEKDPGRRPVDVESFVRSLDDSSASTMLAPELHRWVSRGSRIRPAWAFAAPLAGMLSLVSITSGAGSRFLPWAAAAVTPIALVLGATAILHAGFSISELRRVLRAGYGSDDLALALQRHRSEVVPRPAPLLGRVLHDLGVLAVLGIVIGLIVVREMATAPWRLELWRLVEPTVEAIGWCWMILWTAIGAEFVLQCHPLVQRLKPGFAERFLASPLGRVMTNIASFGLPHASSAPQTLHRPTELMLGLAIEDLWSALPGTARSAMPEVPELAGGLRRRIAELKDALQLIDRHGGKASPELGAIHDRLAERHQAGVTALERIRLLLARLGSAAAPAGEFTAQLNDARAVERSLLEELGAHATLWKALKRGTQPTTLTPNPAG